MSERLFFVHNQTKREFEVLGKDTETGELVIRGMETNAEFKQKFDKEHFKALGYDLVRRPAKEEVDDED